FGGTGVHVGSMEIAHAAGGAVDATTDLVHGGRHGTAQTTADATTERAAQHLGMHRYRRGERKRAGEQADGESLVDESRVAHGRTSCLRTIRGFQSPVRPCRGIPSMPAGGAWAAFSFRAT